MSPGFFAALGVPIIAGRDFTWADSHNAAPVAILSENLAREYWGERIYTVAAVYAAVAAPNPAQPLPPQLVAGVNALAAPYPLTRPSVSSLASAAP